MIAIIDFTEKSREFALSLKEILLFRGGYLADKKTYTETEVKALIKEGWFVWDKTLGRDVSEESILVPKTHLILGRLQLQQLEGLLR